MTAFNEKLRARLEETGATVTWVARKVGTSRQNFHLWLAGRTRPEVENVEVIERLAEWLGEDVSDLRGQIAFETLIAKGWTKDEIVDLVTFAKGVYVNLAA